MLRIDTFGVSSGRCRGRLSYYVSAALLRDDDGVRKECFDIEVVSLPGGEREYIRALTTSRRSAVSLVRTMARLRVTPATARDVAYDWVYAQYEVRSGTGARK